MNSNYFFPGRAFRGAAAAAIAAMLLAGSGAARAETAPLDIPTILPLTGFGAFIGHSQAEALAVVEKNINATGGVRGRDIRFVIYDSQSNPQVDIQLTTAELAKHPAIVIDGGPATVCRGIAPLYAQGPVLWCMSPAFFPAKDGYAFATGVESRLGMETTLRYLRTAGVHRIGLITATDVAGQEADAAIASLLAQPAFAGLSVVAAEHFAPADLTVTAQLTAIAQAHPDVIVAWATGTPLATVLHGIKDGAFAVPVVTSNANQSWQQMQQYATILPARYLMYSLKWPAYSTMRGGPLKDALADYLRVFNAAGAHPDGNTAMVWDTAMIVARALRTLGPDASADSLRSYLLGLHEYYGASGSFDFRLGNQRGLGLADCIMVQWNAGRQTWDPVSAAAGMPL